MQRNIHKFFDNQNIILNVFLTMQVPQSIDEWKAIADGFQQRWNFPLCLGAIDGKHVVIKKPLLSGSTFYNYKQTCSIVLMAVVDFDYKFTFVDVGCQGRIGDAGVFQNSDFYNALETNTLNIPGPTQLPGSDVVSPYVFVADEAFPLKTYMMKPFARRGLNTTERVFNYRLSRARRIVENAFGILAARFRVFRAPMEVAPEKVKCIVLAATVLHNFLRTKSQQSITEGTTTSQFQEDLDDEINKSLGMRHMRPCVAKNVSRDAKTVRTKLAEYFSAEGQVSWQWKMVGCSSASTHADDIPMDL